MARQNATTAATTEAKATSTKTRSTRTKATKAEDTVNPTEEVTMSENTATEAPEVENTATETAEVKAEAAPVDITAFVAVVEAVSGTGEPTTGEIPAESIAKVNEEYRKLEGAAAKKAARDHLDEALIKAVGALDPIGARCYSDLRGNLKAGSAPKGAKAPTDPTEAFVAKVAAHQIAYGLVAVPTEGIAEDWADKVQATVTEVGEQITAFKTWLDSTDENKGDAPEVSPIVRQAFKLAAGKVARAASAATHTGPRRDVAKHIQSAFADKAQGEFLSVAEIASHKSVEYGDASPSQGAISARLFPASGKPSTIEGVVSVDKGERDGKNPKGAAKA